MRTLNVVFEDRDFAALEAARKRSGLNWRDFLLRKAKPARGTPRG